MDFKDYYKLPFKLSAGYIFADNGNMVFTFRKGISKKIQEQILNTLNNNTIQLTTNKYSIKNYIDLYNHNIYYGNIRGWGGLTGRLKLSVKEAEKVQDDFAQWMINKLNNRLWI